jgi:opacity protein-like surface antigen
MLGQTERFRMTDAVTNQFSDSSNAVGGGLSAGYLFPLGNNIFVGPAVSVDFLNQNTNHDFAGGFFLGQTINTITTVSGQVAFAPLPGLLFYGEAGAAFANVTQKLNFTGLVTTSDQTVTGLNVGIGAAFQPFNWQIAGIPVVVFGQYNHIFLPDTQFINPGSPAFTYNNQTDIDKVEAGIRLQFNAYDDPATYDRRIQRIIDRQLSSGQGLFH